MLVARELTQIPAEELVSYADFLDQLQALKRSPRVRIECLDRTYAGRGIYGIVIANDSVIPDLDQHRLWASRSLRPRMMYPSLADRQVQGEAIDGDNCYSVLIMGETFGHEASHVEALLDLATHLAWDADEEVYTILEKLIVIIVPMANPDGREMAIELWRKYPLAEDSSVAGNLYGFYVNRDFLHLTQPEGKAILHLVTKWNPIAIYDTHEDAFLLGVVTPEICWYPQDGVATASLAPRNIQEIVSTLGTAIHEVWDQAGYNYYPQNMFAFPMIGQPVDQPRRFSLGNITGAASLHGIPALITESARTPGTQIWKDRVEQKFTAGMAVLGRVAHDPLAIARTIRSNAEANLVGEAGDAFIIPVQQKESGMLATLVNILLRHDLYVYHTTEPEQAYVVPLAQPRAPVVRELLSAEHAKLMALPPALGINVLRLSQMSAYIADWYKQVALTRVIEAPVLRIKPVAHDSLAATVIPNTIEGIKLVNSLLQVGYPVDWLAESITTASESLEPGAFLVKAIPQHLLQTLASGLHLRVARLELGTEVNVRRLYQPIVALYRGQGVDRPHSSPVGELWYGLQKMGFTVYPVEAGHIREDWLEWSDVLVIPEGNARDIVHGWDPGSRRNSDAWDLPGEPQGIGIKGLAVIRRYIESGGAYIGFGSGGGLLATNEYAELVDLTVLHHRLGSGRVILKVEELNHPLVYGLNGMFDVKGTWHPGLFPAMYSTESFSSISGGPIFRAGKDVQSIAYFHSVDYDPQDYHILQPELFDLAQRGVAVAFQEVGDGTVTVIGVRAGFRAIWNRSLKLVSNAIFYRVAGEVETCTL